MENMNVQELNAEWMAYEGTWTEFLEAKGLTPALQPVGCRIAKKQVAEYHRRYRQAHKKQVAEYQRRYRQAHKKQVAEYKRRWYQAHKSRLPSIIGATASYTSVLQFRRNP